LDLHFDFVKKIDEPLGVFLLDGIGASHLEIVLGARLAV